MMGDRSKIEWTDATWNPVTGCTKVSAGCKFCYAERDFHRPYPGRDFTDVQIHPERLLQPFHWRRPRRIFVDSMSDLFHESIPEDFIDQVFMVMVKAKQHTFQVLTKRPEIMREFMHLEETEREWDDGAFPPGNIWLGVPVEDQPTADERITLLLQTPAVVRFVSYEPALGPVEFHPWYLGLLGEADFPNNGKPAIDYLGPRVNWVIAGGESGPNARPSHPEWFRSVRDQCQAAGVPFFFKQWGEWAPIPGESFKAKQFCWVVRDGSPATDENVRNRPVQAMARIGKKRAGRLLDGREWNEFPKKL
jgi:protein gp37